MSIVDKSQQLRDLASTIRSNVLARDAIADAFDLIAEAMSPCEDCGNPQPQNVVDVAAAVIDTTAQALVDHQADPSADQAGDINAGA